MALNHKPDERSKQKREDGETLHEEEVGVQIQQQQFGCRDAACGEGTNPCVIQGTCAGHDTTTGHLADWKHAKAARVQRIPRGHTPKSIHSPTTHHHHTSAAQNVTSCLLTCARDAADPSESQRRSACSHAVSAPSQRPSARSSSAQSNPGTSTRSRSRCPETSSEATACLHRSVR